MIAAFTKFDFGLTANPCVRIFKRGGGRIALTPLDKPMTSLLDMLKEADLRIVALTPKSAHRKLGSTFGRMA